MGKYSRGVSRTYSRVKYGLLRVDPLVQGATRVGKQSKYGAKKGSTPPGNHSNKVKVR